MIARLRVRGIWGAGAVAVLALLVAAWLLVTETGTVPGVFLPSPVDVLDRLVQGFTDGRYPQLLGATVLRMIVGWFLASVLGVLVGALIGLSARMSLLLTPTLELLRPIPASALIPVVIALAGIRSETLLLVVALGSIWPVVLATVHGFRTVDDRLAEVGRMLSMSRSTFAAKVALPHALPDIVSGMRLSLTAALVVTVVGEMVTSQTGLGSAILLASSRFDSHELFAGVVLLSCVGVVNNAILTLLERLFLPWSVHE